MTWQMQADRMVQAAMQGYRDAQVQPKAGVYFVQEECTLCGCPMTAAYLAVRGLPLPPEEECSRIGDWVSSTFHLPPAWVTGFQDGFDDEGEWEITSEPYHEGFAYGKRLRQELIVAV